jgi:hypothetical protein
MQEIAAKQESSARNGTAAIENLCSGRCGSVCPSYAAIRRDFPPPFTHLETHLER